VDGLVLKRDIFVLPERDDSETRDSECNDFKQPPCELAAVAESRGAY
jgi:hypothetical protein